MKSYTSKVTGVAFNITLILKVLKIHLFVVLKYRVKNLSIDTIDYLSCKSISDRYTSAVKDNLLSIH